MELSDYEASVTRCHHLVLPVDLRLFLLEGLGVELERLLRALP